VKPLATFLALPGSDRLLLVRAAATLVAFTAEVEKTLRTVETHYAGLFEDSPSLAVDGNLVFTGGNVAEDLSQGIRGQTEQILKAIDALLEEITDRFGKLPAQGQALFDTHRLRVLARPYGVLKIDAGPKLMNIVFRPNPPIDALKIIALVQNNRAIKLAGNDKLRIERELTEPKDRAQLVRDVLKSLGQPKTTTEATPA